MCGRMGKRVQAALPRREEHEHRVGPWVRLREKYLYTYIYVAYYGNGHPPPPNPVTCGALEGKSGPPPPILRVGNTNKHL